MEMNERKQRILLAIIQEYVSTAEPVGSRTIARKCKLGVSPATIRNEMADLEEMGLIKQPYTSAGRIPSDKGYRYYVDYLMEKICIDKKEEEYIREIYKRKLLDLEEVIRKTGDLISGLTDYTAITLGPQFSRSKIQYIKLVDIDLSRALLIVVTNTGVVEHKVLDIPDSIASKDLDIISEVLSEKLCGTTLDNISKTILEEVYTELRVQRYFLDRIFNVVEEVLWKKDDTKVYLDGTRNILKQPEFKDIEKLHSLLSLLEEEHIVRSLIGESAPEGLTIKIGTENRLESVNDCSLVTATYSIGGNVLGSVGVLGPTRMNYSKVITLVDFVTETLSYALTKYYG